jgi:hypothetical protein
MDFRNLFRGKKKRTPIPDPDPVPASASVPVPAPAAVRKSGQPIELGTIDYCNLTADGKHGDFDAALRAATETGQPIFANFVEWSG